MTTGWHRPPAQVPPDPQLWLQAPQWAASDDALTQVPPQIWLGDRHAQSVPEQVWFVGQVWDVWGPQTPLPSHWRAGTFVPLAQVAAAHSVPAGHLRQPPLPLQVPSKPQLLAAAGLQSLECALPAWTFAHVPVVCPVLVARQERQTSEHATLQHTPSVHTPLAHSYPALQAAPRALVLTQLPLPLHALLVPQTVPAALPLHEVQSPC